MSDLKKFAVWCPDRGQTKEDSKSVVAPDPESAVERWAQWDDASSADYLIVGGQECEVLVAREYDGAPEYTYIVTGESVPSYRARLKVKP